MDKETQLVNTLKELQAEFKETKWWQFKRRRQIKNNISRTADYIVTYCK